MKLKTFRFKKVNSTNNTAIRIIKKTNLDYGMIISEMQNNGRGQYGKKWISYKGNLFISFFYSLEKIDVALPSPRARVCQVKRGVGDMKKEGKGHQTEC